MKNYITTAALTFVFGLAATAQAEDGNRLTHLDAQDPFYVDHTFPKLTTPQWVGDPDVEAVVILAIDDMRDSQRYEDFLRPILDRLKQIDGRAPVSVFSNALNETEPRFQSWLEEGLSIEVHTEHHPCPLLAGGDLSAALKNVYRSIDRLNRIPHTGPVAYRMPCCDSINSPSPRFYSEIFPRVTERGAFLEIDSSVVNLFTAADPDLPEDLLTDEDGDPRFTKYAPFPAFTTTIENYPYPYVFNRIGWEFPCSAPSDWEAQNLHGVNQPETVRDWKRCLDATVLKQGVMTWVFHPHGWIRADQVIEFIDYSQEKFGNRVLFLTFPEALERLNQNLLKGQSLRGFDGEDGGARLLDLNGDGYLDVTLGASCEKTTRVWDPAEQRWVESVTPLQLSGKPKGFPALEVTVDPINEKDEPITVSRSALDWDPGVRWAVLKLNGVSTVVMLQSRTTDSGEWLQSAWRWSTETSQWVESPKLWNGWDGLEERLVFSDAGVDQGMRFRDVDGDGSCEALIANPDRNAAWVWNDEEKSWQTSDWTLPVGTCVVDGDGRDDGLRWVDLNGDGHDDVIHSNSERYSVHLYMPEWLLGWSQGWTRETMSGFRTDSGSNAIPMISRGGDWPNNGAWFRKETLWVQNENTAGMPDLVDRRKYYDLLAGELKSALTPSESLASMEIHPDFQIELVVSEPLIQDPVAFDWGEDGSFWVVEMRDYPNGTDGLGKSGGVVKKLQDLNGDGQFDRSTTYLSGLNFPSGIKVWGKGAWITAAPDILWTEDTDGDGKADVVEKWATGFGEGNQQHRVNGFEWGLDGWLYIANGDSGGSIQDKTGETVFNLQGRDLKMHPVTGELDWVQGQTQFGRRRDDWGNWFGNSNPIWLWHYGLERQYAERNPLNYASRRVYMARSPEMAMAFPVSQQPQRFNVVGEAGYVTSANSPTPYRDNWFGAEMQNAIFISEPAQSLVRRFHLEADGASFRPVKVEEEKEKEFLASRDPWFRPTQLRIGPDGALYIADMYRQHIEHPEYIPDDVDQWTTFREGETLGRIYRVTPKNPAMPRRQIADLTTLTSEEWLLALESPNGWIRDHAQMKLMHEVEAGEEWIQTAKDLFQKTTNPKTRVHLLWVLQNWQAFDASELKEMILHEADPRVRIQTLQVAEALIKNQAQDFIDNDFWKQLLAAEDSALLFQTALTLGTVAEQTENTEGSKLDPDLWRFATERVLSHESTELQEALLTSAAGPQWNALMEGVIRSIKTTAQPIQWSNWIQTGVRQNKVTSEDWNRVAENLYAALEKSGIQTEIAQMNLESIQQSILKLPEGIGSRKALAAVLDKKSATQRWFEVLRDLSLDPETNPAQVERSVRLIGAMARLKWIEVPDLLIADWLASDRPQAVQEAALDISLQLLGPSAILNITPRWNQLSPQMKQRLIATARRDQEYTSAWIYVFENNRIPANQISVYDQEYFKNLPWERLAQRARLIWPSTSASDNPSSAWTPGPGDVANGRQIFENQCAICHQLRGKGAAVGPALDNYISRPWNQFLTAVTDPDSAIDPGYQSCLIETTDGSIINGVAQEIGTTTVILKLPGGETIQIQRDQIKTLEIQTTSLMPKGLDAAVGEQGMRDMWKFLRGEG